MSTLETKTKVPFETPHLFRVGFGILAWNEATCIGATLASIAEQNLATQLTPWLDHLQIAVMVNGSTDGTADVARAAISEFKTRNEISDRISFEVYELDVANRQAAWNHFVHSSSLSNPDFLGFMDADIMLSSDTTLERMINALAANSEANLCAARPIKDVELSSRRSLSARLSALATGLEHHARKPCIAGPLYLARASFLKRIYAPYGLCADDAMFTYLAWTDFLTRDVNPNRIAMCDSAGFVFEAYGKIKDLWRQHRRREIGRMMRHLVGDEFTKNRKDYVDAAAFMEARFTENPNWLIELARSKAKVQGWQSMAWKPDRLTQLAYQPWYKAVVLSPFALAFCVWSLFTSLAAHRTLTTQPISAVWKKDANKRIVNSNCTPKIPTNRR